MNSARIVSVSTAGSKTVDENAQKMASYLETAAQCQPDFVVFTEIARELGTTDWGENPGEPIPGPTTEAIGQAAKKANTHVVFGMIERDDDHKHNASVLLGRDGEVIGRYHKVQPTIGEMEKGIVPGTGAPTWETDRGQVGMCICFDLKFPEVAMMLARSRARIVFFSSMFNGGTRQEAWARDYGVFLVTSQGQQSSIVDPCGRRLAWMGSEEPKVVSGDLLPFAVADINTDCKTYHLDFNQDKLGDIQKKYGLGVRFHIMRREATFVLESMMDDVSVEDVEREFELEDLWTYYDRARGVKREVLGSALAKGTSDGSLPTQ